MLYVRPTFTLRVWACSLFLMSGCWMEYEKQVPSPVLIQIRPICKTEKKCQSDIKHYCGSKLGKVISKNEEDNIVVIECEREHAQPLQSEYKLPSGA